MALRFLVSDVRTKMLPKLIFKDEDSKEIVHDWLKQRGLTMNIFKKMLFAAHVFSVSLTVSSVSPNVIRLESSFSTWKIGLYLGHSDFTITSHLSDRMVEDTFNVVDSNTLVLTKKKYTLSDNGITITTYYDYSRIIRKYLKSGNFTLTLNVVYTSDQKVPDSVAVPGVDFCDIYFKDIQLSELYNLDEVWSSIERFFVLPTNDAASSIQLALSRDETEVAKLRIENGILESYGERSKSNESCSLCYSISNNSYIYNDSNRGLSISSMDGNLDVHFTLPKAKIDEFDLKAEIESIDSWVKSIIKHIEQYNNKKS